MCGRENKHCKLKNSNSILIFILYTYINSVLITLYQKRFRQTNVENCNSYLFVGKKLTRRYFCNAGADEKPGIYFIWPNLYSKS